MSSRFHNALDRAAWLGVNPRSVEAVTADGTASETRLRLEAAPELPARLHVLFAEHASFVFRSLRQLGLREAEIDEALAQVFLLVDPARSVDRAELYARCKQLANGRFLEEQPMPYVTGVDRAALAFGQRLLLVLPPDQREVFSLYEVEDFSVPEIARALRQSEPTVRAQLRAARQRVIAEVERLAAESQDD